MLAAASLSRPEVAIVVAGITVFGAIATWRALGVRSAWRWLVPLAAPLAWVTANKLFAGHWFPNTGVVKSHFYLPGFDWTYWRETVRGQTKAMFRALFWVPTARWYGRGSSRCVALVGAARVIVWAVREKKPLVGAVAIGAPFALMFAVVATSGVGNGITVTAYDFQNYRYVATVFPLVFVLVGFALAPPAGAAGFWSRARPRVRDGRMRRGGRVLLRRVAGDEARHTVVRAGCRRHQRAGRRDRRVRARQAARCARDVPRRRCDRVLRRGPVFDMLGLVTDDQAAVANNGPGSRFEFLDRMPADQRPAYFAYYPSWLGTPDFFGPPVLDAQLGLAFSKKKRLAGDDDMQLLPAVWDHVATGEAPLERSRRVGRRRRASTSPISRASAHTTGPPRSAGGSYGDPTARWSFVDREVMPIGLVIDGGRHDPLRQRRRRRE